jgi:hypothetical protein
MHVKDPVLYVFQTRAEVSKAIRSLEKTGFDLRKLSLIGKGYHTSKEPIGFYIVGERIKSWGANGEFWSGIWTMLHAPAVFLLPGLGVIAMAGPVTAAVIAALEGVVTDGGVSALGAALCAFGAPHREVAKYETAVKEDKYVLVIHGDAADTRNARSVLTEILELETA